MKRGPVTPAVVAFGLAVAVTGLEAQSICTTATEAEASQAVSILAPADTQLETLVRFRQADVLVDPGLWNTLNLEGKESLTRILAVYKNCIWFSENGGTGRKLDSWRVTVLDMQTGRRLASIGGFLAPRIRIY